MAAELQTMEAAKRNPKHRKKPFNRPAAVKRKKPNLKMKKLFKKRAREYNSDDEEDDDDTITDPKTAAPLEESSDEEERRDSDAGGSDEDSEGGEASYEITRFAEGCRSFKMAFLKIMKQKLSNDPLGPILSANKKLIAEKLAEEETDHKANAEAKKEKNLAMEKGHVKPASFLDAKEKLLISVATKGVVKLFNAVNKAQNPQKGFNPSNSKDTKELAKRRKQVFLSELKTSTTESIGKSSSFNIPKVHKSANKGNEDEPGWAPLRDNYMLTNSKLKDWDKMADPVLDDTEKVPVESSSGEE